MTFTLLSFNLLHFISTPYNHSLTRAWFYLRYKIRKLYKALCCPFCYCFEGCEFPPSLSLFSFSLLCRKPDVRIFFTNYARSFCSHLGGVCFMCVVISYFFCNCARGLYFSGHALMYISCDLGECCESVP